MLKTSKTSLLLLLLAFPLQLLAQREAANWYFGTKAGLTFNSGEAVPLLDGELDTLEGCESISNANGDLQFYTDGKVVFTRNHQIMPNGEGLLGSVSSTQSALVVPKPKSNSIYYIFTADDVRSYQTNDGDGDGFNYSVVDMSLNGGLGDVVEKNIQLLDNGSEKVTAVGKADGQDFWVVTHYRDSFYAYEITEDGVNETPVVSVIGPNVSDFNNFRGAMKSSPVGDRIAICHTIFEPSYRGELRLYDFDRETGVLSNELLVDESLVYYGVEFSSNSKQLFASGKIFDPAQDRTTQINVVQFDLTAPNITSTLFTQASITNNFQGDLAGSLQIAINRKIYHSIPAVSLSVINSPNNYGLDADFRAFDVTLGGRTSKFGLPPYIQSFFESVVRAEQFCFGDETQFFIETDEPIDSISWNFGDPASGANNNSTLLEPTHVFSSTGVFTVTIDVNFQNGVSKTFIEFIEIADSPQVNPFVDLVQCDVDGNDDGRSIFNLNEAIPLLVDNPLGYTANFFLTLDDAIENAQNIDPIGYANTEDGQIIYARVFQDALCFEIAEVRLLVEPMSQLEDRVMPACNRSAGPLVVIIEVGDLLETLSEEFPGSDITFFPTRQDALLETEVVTDEFRIPITAAPEIYFRVEDLNACAFIGKIDLEILFSPNIEDQQVVLCPNEPSVTISPGPDFLRYEWSTGETTPSIDVSVPGTYEVTVFNGADCDDTAIIEVTRPDVPMSLEVVVRDFSDNNQILVEIDQPDAYQYGLDDNALQSSPVFDDLAVGPYTVFVWREGCLIYEETVLVGGPPNFFTPNNDGFHDLWQITARRELQDARISIFDRFGKMIKQMRGDNMGWDGTYLGNPLPSSDYWYRIVLNDGRTVTGNFSLKR
ncbi:T9SS type B sorting domain-containing protein [Aureitalea marina]|uniref:PKD domain-containing protein n=1 Tax=Aureitalea marina TaxID=930804 RepID=A0A2S7KPU2_9FLAO|nr:T9SS type B sorting domain-containing protein [Aureitalea marina]PQB04598.1 hypothetical protein BST85_06570 [Aureitalea marina]